MNKYNHPKAQETFCEIVKIYSESWHEKNMIDWLNSHLNKEKYKKAGLSIEILPVVLGEHKTSQLVAFLPKNIDGKKTIFFDAHIDTVPRSMNIEPLILEDRIISKGDTILAGDDKAGVAINLTLIDELIDKKIPHGDIYFFFLACEEIGLIGAKQLPIEKYNVDYGFVLDGDGKWGNILIGSPHHYGYRIEVIGKSSHAGIEPEKGINAISIAANIINQLPQGRIDHETTANIGGITGGVADNVVAPKTTITGEFRSFSQEKCEQLKQQIEDVCHANKGDGIIDISFPKADRGYELSQKNPLLEMTINAHEKVGCDNINPMRTGGGTHANIYNNKNIPAIVFSLGMYKIHTTDEWLDLKTFDKSIDVCLELIKNV